VNVRGGDGDPDGDDIGDVSSDGLVKNAFDGGVAVVVVVVAAMAVAAAPLR
jgi:hypothetical protein